MYDVKPELTGERDLAFNDRHRLWGFHVPAVDIDFLLLEYNRARAAALVEYKRVTAPKPNMEDHTFRALRDLADRAGLPLFVCRYTGRFDGFIPIPLNARASALVQQPIGEPPARMWSEEQYVDFLYRVHGQHGIPDAVAAKVNSWPLRGLR